MSAASRHRAGPRAAVIAGAVGALLAVAPTSARRQPSTAAHGPEIVAPGVVSTAAPEFATTLTPDGGAIYFTRASEDRARLTIMTATRTDSGAWSTPVVAPFSGSGARDVDPFVTPDGRRLYFSSDRPRPGAVPGTLATWYVERASAAAAWGSPVDPGAPLNSTAGDVFVSAARDGTVVFTSSREGPPRIFLSRPGSGSATGPAAGPWASPAAVTLGDRIDAGNPALAPSGRFLIVTLPGAGGAPDLYVSCRAGAAWAAPRRLDAVNSSYADFAPYVSADETTLYFTSERPGVAPVLPAGIRPPGDLYRIALADAGARCP